MKETFNRLKCYLFARFNNLELLENGKCNGVPGWGLCYDCPFKKSEQG